MNKEARDVLNRIREFIRIQTKDLSPDDYREVWEDLASDLEDWSESYLLPFSEKREDVRWSYAYCLNEDCRCHKTLKYRVVTPFPLNLGPIYCCGRCASSRKGLTK